MTFGDILKVYAGNDPKVDFSYLANLGIQNTLSELSTSLQALATAKGGGATPASIIENAYKASEHPMAELANLGVEFDPADIFAF